MHVITKVILFLSFGTTLMACQNKAPETIQQECYAYIENRDTVLLTIKTTGLQVSGNLKYNLFEKDRNAGSVVGKIMGDTLLMNYSFESEGMKSVRQVAFLKKGDLLIEGFADVQEKDSTVIFKHLADLKFNSTIVLKKTNCAAD